MATTTYTVVKDAFIKDIWRLADSSVDLTDEEAKYLLLARAVKLPSSPPSAAPTVYAKCTSVFVKVVFDSTINVLFGRVKDSTNAPVVGATVSVFLGGSGTADGTATTDAAGRFAYSLNAETVGSHTFSVSVAVKATSSGTAVVTETGGSQPSLTDLSASGLFPSGI